MAFIHFQSKPELKDVVRSAVFSPDGYFVLTATSAGNAKIWNATRPQVVELSHFVIAKLKDTFLTLHCTMPPKSPPCCCPRC